MKNDNNRALFDAVNGIDDDLIEEAAAPKALPFPKRILRVAAIAAAVAILMTALLFLDGNNNHTPYFSVYVYANETESVELCLDGEKSAMSNLITNDRPNFGSSFEDDKPTDSKFRVNVLLNDQTKNYERIAVFCNGKEIKQSFEGILVAFIANAGSSNADSFKPIGLSIGGSVEEPATVALVLYDDDGSILQRYVIQVTPIEEGFNITLIENYIKPA